MLKIYNWEFLAVSINKGLINISNLFIAGDGTPVSTSARERKHRVCDCAENDISDCNCERYFSQLNCDIESYSSNNCFYHGYDLYMLVAVNSESDLLIFPLLNPAYIHDFICFWKPIFVSEVSCMITMLANSFWTLPMMQ